MSEIHNAVGSYVVHALDESERQAFEGHLEVCETCRREVLEFAETAAHLGGLVEAPPPPELRGSVLAAIGQVRPLPPEVPVTSRAEAGSGAASGDNVVALAGPRDRQDDTSSPRRVDELGMRRRRAQRLLAFATAAAVVVALALGGWAVGLDHQRQAQVAEAALESQLMTAPDAKIYSKTIAGGGHVSFVVSRSLDKALFVGDGMAAAGPDRSYQLWTQGAQGLTPDATFDGRGTVKTWFHGSVRDADGVALSLEPTGGSPQPTTVLVSVPT